MIELKNISKKFGSHTVIDNISLTIEAGDFLVIIGRSGEGKSILFKQIIGLISPDTGAILIDGKDITNLDVFEQQKMYAKCGYVFQFAALLDSLTIFENIGITLLEKNIPLEKVRPLVIEKLNDVGLHQDTLNKYPNELSGGMKKRVGLARTLMLKPEILLYDEPTTGLDPITVHLIHELIACTHAKQKTTTLVISHDPRIFRYATRVVMLYQGKIIYQGSAKSIWNCHNAYVHQFIRGLPEGPISNN